MSRSVVDEKLFSMMCGSTFLRICINFNLRFRHFDSSETQPWGFNLINYPWLDVGRHFFFEIVERLKNFKN